MRGKPWENGKFMGNSLETHGKMGKSWENHRKTMGKSWENGNLMMVKMMENDGKSDGSHRDDHGMMG